MKTQLACLVLLIGISNATAQLRTVNVGYFSEISLGVSGTLYLTQGENEKIEIEASDDVFDRIKFKIEGSKLKIKNKNNLWGSWSGNSRINVYVTMKDIDGISVSGSGSIIGKNRFKTEDIRLSVSGSGRMDIKTNSEDIYINVSGSGRINLSGSTDNADVSISGSGKVKAQDLEVRICKASISGSGNCYITVTKEIDTRMSGSGSVYYAGHPDKVNSRFSGSGKVRKI